METPKGESLLYEDVLLGSVFLWEGNYYMAMDDCESSCSCDNYNAINLQDGELCFFDSVDTVTVVKAKLIIEE